MVIFMAHTPLRPVGNKLNRARDAIENPLDLYTAPLSSQRHSGEGRESIDERVLPRHDLAERIDSELQRRIVLLHAADLISDLDHRLRDVRVGAHVPAAADEQCRGDDCDDFSHR